MGPDTGRRGLVAFDEMLLPRSHAVPLSEIAQAKTLFLYHDVVLAADPILAWAHEFVGTWPNADRERELQKALAEILLGLVPILPLIEEEAMLLIPPVGAIEAAYHSGPITSWHLDHATEPSYRIFDQLPFDELDPIAGVFDEYRAMGLSLWAGGVDDAMAEQILVDPVLAPFVIREAGVARWELEAHGFDLTDDDDLAEAAAVVIDQVSDAGDDLGDFARSVLRKVGGPETQEIVDAIQFDAYLTATRQHPLPILSTQRKWAHVRRLRSHHTSPTQAVGQYALPSADLFGWREVVQLRADEDVFAGVRDAFALFQEQVKSGG